MCTEIRRKPRINYERLIRWPNAHGSDILWALRPITYSVYGTQTQDQWYGPEMWILMKILNFITQRIHHQNPLQSQNTPKFGIYSLRSINPRQNLSQNTSWGVV